MKIDSIDIRSFDAKQLTVDFEPPQTGVTVEMFDGALIPSESETYTPLSGLTVTVLFRGKDRDEVQKHVSDFNAELQKGVVLTLDGYSRHFKAYAHTDADGNVLPVTYFPMYEGSVVNSRMRSLSGLTPTASMTDEQETTAAKQNGDRWDKQSFSEINLMYEMCTMITCSTNSQGKFGNGNSQSDNFLQTGTLNGKGQFFGYTSTTQAVKVFYCENFFANYWKRLRGLLLINGVYHVKAVPPYNSTGAGYTNTGLTPSGTSGGYCSRMEMASDIGRIPTVASGSETTYECDGLWFNNTIVAVALFGGSRGNGSRCGLSCWDVSHPATDVATYIVASLSCKPPVAAA